MAALSITAILHVMFIPGLILRRWVRLPGNFFVQLASVAGISLIVNYLIVFLLTSLQVFTPAFARAVILIELILLFYLYRRELGSLRMEDFFTRLWNRFVNAISFLFNTTEDDHPNRLRLVLNSIFALVFFVAAIVVVDWMIGLLRYNTGRVFETWDAVVSWNRWAMDWSNNQFPFSTQDYPQLIPTAWAMIYNVSGSQQVQFFSKGIMPVFPLLILIMILAMGLKTRNYGYFIALVGLRYLFKKLVGEFIIAGYVDLALTFFALLSIFMLYYFQKAKTEAEKKNYLFLSLLFACGSAVTKQPGFAVLLVWGLFFVYYLFTRFKVGSLRKEGKFFILLLAVLLAVVAPWYLMKNIEFMRGLDTSHLLSPPADTQGVHQAANMSDLFKAAMASLGNPLYFFLFVLPATFLVEKFWRVISLIFVLPYTILWAVYASYDTRNIIIVLPVVAILVGLGLKKLADYALDLSERLKFTKTPMMILVIISILLLAGLSFLLPEEKLVADQIEKQKQIFSPSLNAQLYEYQQQHGLEGKILTNYPVNYLPDLKGYQVEYQYQDLDLMLDILSREDVSYLLVPQNADGAVMEWIEEKTRKGELREVFSNWDFIHYSFLAFND